MITVEDIIETNKNSDNISSEQNEEMLKTGEIKAVKQSYWPWVFLIAGAVGLGWWLWKKGKQENGTISG